MPDIAKTAIDSEEECFVVETKKSKKTKKAKYEKGYYKGTEPYFITLWLTINYNGVNIIPNKKCMTERKRKRIQTDNGLVGPTRK